MNKINNWYKKNIGKILLLSIVLTFFTVTVKLVPYFSFLFSGEVGFSIVIIVWYLLFLPSTKLLVFIVWGLLPIAFLSAYFQLDTISNFIGNFMYLDLLLIFMNYIRDYFKNKNKILR